MTALLVLTAGVSACGSDSGPVGVGDDGVDDDGVSEADGIAMCTPVGADASWRFARLGVGTKPSLALDAGGGVAAAFINEAQTGWIRYASLPAGSSTPSAVSTVATGYFYGPIDVVMGQDGAAQVLYHDHTREDQVLATQGGSSGWSQHPMNNSGHDGWYSAGVFDAAGTLHTASYDPGGFQGRGVIYGGWDGNSWSTEVAAPGSFDYAGGMAIANTTGGIRVVFFDDVAGVAKIASRTGADDWTVSTVEPKGTSLEVGRFPDVVYDAATDELHMVYLARTSGSAGSIRYARGSVGALEARHVIDISNFSIGFSGARDIATLALDGSGTPIVAAQSRSDLTIVRVTDTDVETIASMQAATGVTFGQQTEIAIDGQGRPHIIWWQTGESPGTVCYGVKG